MAIKCPIRQPDPPKTTTTVYARDPDRQPGPVTRPVFPLDLDREQRIKDAMKEVRDTYDRYQLALAKFKAIGGPKPDPTIDATQIRFAFADQYVTEHYSLYQPNPALYGPNSSRLVYEPHENRVPLITDQTRHKL